MKLIKVAAIALIFIGSQATFTMDSDFEFRKQSYEKSLKLNDAVKKGDFNEVKIFVKDNYGDSYIKYLFLPTIVYEAEKSGNKEIAPFLKDWAAGKLEIENIKIDQPGKQAQPGEQQPYPGGWF
ncbi:hypothetical protein HYX58_03220 [Candidatus Dependentiae bacterium]|nr:hypothetical protein [Candidatus Dependentiae bacterium]